MSYTVKFLDSESFDKLPYSKSYDSLGVADQKTGIAYVRDTQSPMDVFTAMHELEHLRGDDLEEHATVGEPGVYYKDFGQMFQNVAPAVGGFLTGGPVGGALGAAGSFGANKAQKSAQKQMQSQQDQQSQMMGQFNPGAATSQPSMSPAVSQVGQANAGGGVGNNNIGDTIRQMLAERQSGNYAGRA